jgi:CubicO group peptidase (beta-lactamase class C family)
MAREHAPDTICRYNSCDTQALAAVVRAATGANLADYMQTRLMEPLGMTDTGAWIVDPFGVEMGYAGLNLTARDYAKFGELYRLGGVVNDTQIVPADWVATSVRSTAPHTEPGQVIEGSERLAEGYGYQWWIPAGAEDTFSAIGVYNQFVYVHPAHEVTVVKLSANRAYGTTTAEEQNREGETLAFLEHCATVVAGH